MPIAAHIVRSLTEVLKRERESHSLFLISGMPGVGKTSLVKAVFSDLAYVDLNDISLEPSRRIFSRFMAND